MSALTGVACTTNGRNDRDNPLVYISRSNEMDNQLVSNAFTEDCTVTPVVVSCHVTCPPPVHQYNTSESSMLYISRLSTGGNTTTTKTVTSSSPDANVSCSPITSISDTLVASNSIGTVCISSTSPVLSFTDYMTMWQLSTAYKGRVVESVDEFYVPALLDHLPPSKACGLY